VGPPHVLNGPVGVDRRQWDVGMAHVDAGGIPVVSCQFQRLRMVIGLDFYGFKGLRGVLLHLTSLDVLDL